MVERGDEVVVLDDLSRGEKSQINSGARFVQGDVRLFSDWEKACEGFDPEVIHHLAAINGTRRFHKEADLVVDVNVNGTRMSLKAAKEYGSTPFFTHLLKHSVSRKTCHCETIQQAYSRLHICTSATPMVHQNILVNYCVNSNPGKDWM